jgi:hypothetical protein
VLLRAVSVGITASCTMQAVEAVQGFVRRASQTLSASHTLSRIDSKVASTAQSSWDSQVFSAPVCASWLYDSGSVKIEYCFDERLCGTRFLLRCRLLGPSRALCAGRRC